MKLKKLYYQHRENIYKQEKKLKEIQHKRESTDQLLIEWREMLSDAKMNLNSIKDRLSVEFDLVLENIDDKELKSEYEKLDFNTLERSSKNIKSKTR